MTEKQAGIAVRFISNWDPEVWCTRVFTAQDEIHGEFMDTPSDGSCPRCHDQLAPKVNGHQHCPRCHVSWTEFSAALTP